MHYHGNKNRHSFSRLRPNPRPPASVQPRQVPAQLGPKIRHLQRADISTELSYGRTEITDCRYLASYNLMEGLSKTILVPGRPPLWTPPAGNMKLSADSGQYYRDENAARFQEHPIEPVVLSVFHMNSNFDPSTIDIVACGSTMGDLLRFVRGKSEGFSFVVQIIGRTAFFVRRNLCPTELIGGIHGFGHSFVDANTTWSPDVKGSSSHQRVISYQLGGKTIIVRFETDGYIMSQDEDFDSDDNTGGVPVSDGALEDDLKRLFGPSTQAVPTERTILLGKGCRTTQSSAIDIKTRSARKKRDDVLAEQIPRLWLRQIENIVLSFHTNGLFGPAAVEDIRSLILRWEDENHSAIARLMNVIDVVKKVASDNKDRKLEVRCEEAEVLQFHELGTTEQAKWHAISDNLCKQWEQRYT